MKTEIPLQKEVYHLNDLLGVDLFVVGGTVRDWLFSLFHGMPFDPKDVDVATPEEPETILSILRNPKVSSQGIRALEIGKSFGVVSAVFPSGNTYEIATFRNEWYDPESGDGRRPDKVSFSSPEEDAWRRDLTINSLFYHLGKKEIMDFVGTGIEDVKNIIIRPVGDAFERYREDRLRVLRTVRFFCKYKTENILDGLLPETITAIGQWKDLPGISSERIKAEAEAGLFKSLCVNHYLQSLLEVDLYPRIFPNLILNQQVIGKITTREPRVILGTLFEENPNLQKQLVAISWEGITGAGADFLRKVATQDWNHADIPKLLRMRERFVHKQLSPEEQAKVRLKLRGDLVETCRILETKPELPLAFMDFFPKSRAADFPELNGPELGAAIDGGIEKEWLSFSSRLSEKKE